MKIKILIFTLVVVFMTSIIYASDGAYNYNDNDQQQKQNQKTSVDIDSNDIDREFPNIGNTPIPGTNGFYTRPTMDSSFRSIKELLSFYDRFTEGACEQMAKGGSVNVHLQVIQGHDIITRVKADDKGDKWIKIVTIKPGLMFSMTAIIDGEAKDGDTNSFQVLGKMALKAIADGNNVLYIMTENQHRMVNASGWGVGLYSVGAKVDQDGMNAGVVGGGLGWATNKSATEDKPWFHGFAGVE